MEEFLKVSCYESEHNKFWFRVYLGLSNSYLEFDIHTKDRYRNEAYITVIDFCKSIVRYDNEFFNAMCGEDPDYAERDIVTKRIKRVVKDCDITYWNGDKIENLFDLIEVKQVF